MPPPGADAPAEPKKKHKAVQDGELIYTSVSQIQKFTPEVGGCPSKWFFRYVLGLPDDPPGKGQLRGTLGHSHIEDYLDKGIDVLDRLEREGKKFMPEPNVRPDGSRHPVPVLVEEHFGPPEMEPEDKKATRAPLAVLDAEGVPVVGYIDLVDPRDPRWLWLKDWKFKKSIGNYGAKPRDLLNPKHESGIQIIGYLEWMRRARAAGHFTQDWAIPAHVTFQTGGGVEVVQTTTENDDGTVKPIRLDSAKGLWETVTHAAIPGMRKAARAKSHTEVPKNENVCHKYRKACPYLGTCQDRMARIRLGFRSKAPAPAVLTEERLMGMLKTMTSGGTTPSTSTPQPIQNASATQAPIPAAAPVKLAPGQATLTAGLAQSGADYEVKGVKCRFLTQVEMGGVKYASFTPIAGGPPVLVGLDEPVSSLAAPLVVPADAPASNPTGGVLVTACVLGDKYDVNGAIGEFTGTSGAGGGIGFFQTTAGVVKLPLTAHVQKIKGEAPAAPAAAPAPTATGQSPTPPHGAGNSTQVSEAPKGAESPSGAEEKPKKVRKLKVEDKTTTPDPAPSAAAPVAAAPAPAPAAAPGGVQTHAVDGTAYGTLEGVKLYFGCSPVGVAAQHLGAYVDGLERQILTATQANICDLRVAADQTLGFSKWKGFLADICRETPPPAGHYVVMGHADERVSLVAETLAARIAALHPGNVIKAG